MFSRKIYLSILIIILIIANDTIWHSSIYGLIFGISYLLWHGYLLGRCLFKRENVSLKILTGSFLILVSIAILGAAAYYLYKLTPLVINLILIFITAAVFSLRFHLPHQLYKVPISSLLLVVNNFLRRYLKLKNFLWQLRHETKNLVLKFLRDVTLIAVYITLTFISWVLVFRGATTNTINSIWDTLSPQFLLTYFLATITLIVLTTSKRSETINLFLCRAHIFLTLMLAVIIYQIGYGFDPFIHRAAEKVIAADGLITPKTPYYIGQYSLVVILSHLLQLSINVIDKILLPLLYSFFIPAFVYVVYRRVTKSKFIIIDHDNTRDKTHYLLPLVLLVFPFWDFIATTPQGLANFLALIIIIGSVLVISKKINYVFSYLLIFTAVACLVTHPLTGIPVLLFAILIFLVSYTFKNYHWQKILIILLLVSSVLALPVVFYLQSIITPNLANSLTLEKLNGDLIKETLTPLIPSWDNKFNIVRDYFHFLGQNIRWLILVLAGYGYYLFGYKNKEPRYLIYPIFFGLMLITYIILRLFIAWKSVIFYEENDYPPRIFSLSFYFLAPLVLAAVSDLTQRIIKQKMLTRLFFILFFSLTITAVLYISYPYEDAYNISRYYSVSQTDIQITNFIHQNTGGDYIVLANQSVAAAALQQFGFYKYYHTIQGETFYYPIPTSSPLYHYYLTMIYQSPTKETMNKTMDFMGVNQAYFVINNYWSDFEKIVSSVKPLADNWQNINNGQAYIFYFKRQ